MKFNSLKLVTAIAVGVLSTSTTWAAWPDDKPIEVIVGYAPGGGTDLMARKLLPFVQKRLSAKAQFIVVNKPGAGGELANGYVARAKADGYTLAVVNMPGFFFQPMTKKTQYQTEDFTLIARAVDDPTILAVRADSKLTTLQGLISQSKQNPGSVSFGHNGVATNGDLAIRMLSKATGVELNAIPYKGTAAQKTDLLGSHLDVAVVSAGEVPELHDGGKGQLRGLVQFTNKRADVLPQVQSTSEVKIPVLMSSERGFAAPKEVPVEIIKKLEQAIADALKDPDFLGNSTDDKVISFMPGAQWEKGMEQAKKNMQPLADAMPKNQ